MSVPRSVKFAQCLQMMAFAVAGLAPLVTHADDSRDGTPILVWEDLPALPNPIGLGGPIVGVHEGTLIVAGGANFPDDPPWSVRGRPPGTKAWHTAIYALQRGGPIDDSDPFVWREMGLLPHPLAYAATISTAEGVYVLGGETFGTTPDPDSHQAETNFAVDEVLLLRWNPSSESIEVVRDALPPLPYPCRYHAAAAIGRRIYVAASHGHSRDSRVLDSKSLWSIDLEQSAESRRWASHPVWPGAAREKMALVSQRTASSGIAGKSAPERENLYLIGGSTWARRADGTPDDARTTHFADGYRFDPLSEEWTRLPDLPWIAEERDVDLTEFRWNPDMNSWVAADRSPSPEELDAIFRSSGRPLGAAPAIAWGDRHILVMSGATGRYVTLPVERRPPFPRELLSFDTQTQSWSRAGRMPVGVVTTTAVRWSNRIVVPSGETRPGVRTPRVQAASVAP